MSISWRTSILFFGLFFLFSNVYAAVKINSISVPPTYELKEDGEPLILDCDFTVDSNDTGFVLKWKHNGVAVYQWIPSKPLPVGLGSLHKRVDVNYVASEVRMKKHSALVIPKPNVNDTGNYSCNVQTFQGNAEQTASLQIIDEADSIKTSFVINPDDTVDVKCEVSKIFPIPKIKLLFDNEERDFDFIQEHTKVNDSYDFVVKTQVKKYDIKDESPITCIVNIPHIDYKKQDEIIFDDPKQSATTKKPFGELTKLLQSDDEVTNENTGLGLKSSLSVILLSFLLTLFR